MDIMFLHNGTKKGQEALKQAVEYFEVFKPEITLVSIGEDVGDASMELDAITKEYEQQRKDIVREAAEWVSASTDLEVSVIQATGDPRKMILEAIKKKSPDVLVLARTAKMEVESVFRKSLGAFLFKNASCHLFIMGPA